MCPSNEERAVSDPPSGAEEERPRLLVEDTAGQRPFMRGILVHSLMAHGVSFEDAFRAANAVRERLRGTARVTRVELARLAREELGEAAPGEEPRAPLPAPIGVTGQGRKTPFSKGILSQSLLAAAIDPNDAFDVAREIEGELRRRGVREMDRRELRRLGYETLKRLAGPRIAERYLVWRRHQEPEKPVILLLGGATGSGKTALALEVAHRLGIPRVLSTDSIRQIMRIMLSPELAPALHASSYDAYRVLPSSPAGADPVIEGFRAQAEIVSVGVRAMMDRAVAENASLVLDGVSIVPGLLRTELYDERAHVIFLVIATLDVEAFRSRFVARKRHESARGPHLYLEHLEEILRIQDHFLELADRYGIPIVDNESFDRSVTSIIRHVTETLRKKGPFDVAEML